MWKRSGLVLVLGLGLTTGCVVAMGNKGNIKAIPGDRQAVVIDGEIYLVDVDSECVTKIDKTQATVSGATATAPGGRP